MRYPDLQIEVVHSGAAFLEATAFMLERYPNVWGNIEVTSAYAVKMKRRFSEAMGTLLASGAGGRIIFATGAVLVHPQPVLEAFYDFTMPTELVEGYGFPHRACPPVEQCRSSHSRAGVSPWSRPTRSGSARPAAGRLRPGESDRIVR